MNLLKKKNTNYIIPSGSHINAFLLTICTGILSFVVLIFFFFFFKKKKTFITSVTKTKIFIIYIEK